MGSIETRPENPKFPLVTAQEEEYSESEDHRMAVRSSKRLGKAKKVEVSIDVGDLKPTPEQVARLKAIVECVVLTWVRADVSDKRLFCLDFNEDQRPCDNQ
jgi:hypothetical protein